MASLAELKASSPAYAQMSDAEFAQRVYQKHYAGKMTFDDFSQRVGAAPKPDFGNVTSGSATTERPQANNSDFARLITGKPRPPAPAPKGYDWQRHERLSRREFTPQEVAEMNPVEQFAYGLQNSVDDLGRGVVQLFSGDSDASRAEEARHRAAQAPLNETTAAKAGRFTGDTALVAAPLARVGQMGRVGQYAASGAAGAAFAGSQPVAGDESRAENAALGGGLGLAGQATGDILMASGKAAAQKVSRELRALYERARVAGINLTPAQLSNSEFVKRVAAQLGKLPLAGGRAVAERQQAAGNRELARLLGQKADSVTPEVVDKAAREIGQKFDDVFASGMRYDTQFLRELGALRQEAAGLDDTAKNALEALIKRVRTQSQNGTMTGRTLQSIDQQARRWASGGGDRQLIAEAFRESLHETFGRQAPAGVKQVWDTARRQWATLRTLEPVAARNTEGGIPLAQLQGAVTATKAGKTARARGRDGDLGALASIGQRIKAPNSSGTAENLISANALNPLAWPAIGLLSAGGLVTRGTLNNPGLAPLLMRQSRGQTRQALAPYARPAAISLFGIPFDAEMDSASGP